MPIHCLVPGIEPTTSWTLLSSVTRRKSPNVYKSCPKIISLEKWKILTPSQNLPRNVGDLGKLIAAKGLKKLPKVQKIAKSGHIDYQWLSLKNGTSPASFCLFSFIHTILHNKTVYFRGADSNSDRRSRRWARWPLDRNHGHFYSYTPHLSLSLFYLSRSSCFTYAYSLFASLF